MNSDTAELIMSRATTLPKLCEQEKGEIALRIMTDEMVMSRNWFEKPNNARREMIARGKELGINPNKLLSLLHDLLMPNLELLFKPITAEEVVAWEKEREERRRQKEAQKTYAGNTSRQ